MMLFLQHFRDLGAVLEGENYSAALVDGHMIDQSVPCFVLEYHRQVVQFTELKEESAQNIALELLKLTLFL
ncbi:hypothetical protein [Oscillibacter sp.]|uniref:hypothetical protein n=1 Tax=Oscillibacter sp. TaxID=1945593 RepID=UPI002608312F|nr:hypothetical protein [Oscillibacter sp.]MDD3347833.1 hypothetical protein [Oscillibacter sp.]